MIEGMDEAIREQWIKDGEEAIKNGVADGSFLRREAWRYLTLAAPSSRANPAQRASVLMTFVAGAIAINKAYESMLSHDVASDNTVEALTPKFAIAMLEETTDIEAMFRQEPKPSYDGVLEYFCHHAENKDINKAIDDVLTKLVDELLRRKN